VGQSPALLVDEPAGWLPQDGEPSRNLSLSAAVGYQRFCGASTVLDYHIVTLFAIPWTIVGVGFICNAELLDRLVTSCELSRVKSSVKILKDAFEVVVYGILYLRNHLLWVLRGMNDRDVQFSYLVGIAEVVWLV
jgi:hypothetical protein